MAKLNAWKSFSVVMVCLLIAALGAAIVPASPVEANGALPNPTFITRDNTGASPATNISIGWEQGAIHQSGTDAIHVTTTAPTTDYAMVGVPTDFVLTENTKISYWGYTVTGSDVKAPDEIWLEFANGTVICNTGPQGTVSQWDEWTLSGSSDWYDPQTLSPVAIADFYTQTVVKVFLGAGSPTSSTGVDVDVYLDTLTIDADGDGTAEYILDDDTGTIEVLCGTFCGITGCTGIQVGINAALPGDTINVAAGTYDEQVVINKSLTLEGAGDTTIVKPSSAAKLTTVLGGQNPYGATKQIAGIIVANEAGVFSVMVKNLKVDGETVTTCPAGADYVTGIFYRETGGTIDTVTVDNMRVDETFATTGYGIYLSSVTNTVSVEVKGSNITNFDKNGLDACGSKLTANIHDNIVTGRGPLPSGDEVQNGIVVANGAEGTVNDNIISNLFYMPGPWTAMGIAFQNSDGSVGNNSVTDCEVGIRVENGNFTAESNNVTGGKYGLCVQYDEPGPWTASVADNTVGGSEWYGIDVGAGDAGPADPSLSLTITIDGNQLTGGPGGGVIIGDNRPGATGSIIATVKNNNIHDWAHGIYILDCNNVLDTVSATITGNTIQNNAGAVDSGIHIESDIDATKVQVHFNNIVGNTGEGVYGVYNGGTGILDATNNWWGDASGPNDPDGTNEVPPCTDDPATEKNADGTGDKVSDNVDYCPWLGAEVEDSKTEKTNPGDDTVDAKTEADTEVEKSGTGTPIITVAKYKSCPECGPTPGGFQAAGDYVDVHLDTTTNVTEIQVKNYYTAADITGLVESSLRMYYCTGSAWIQCSDSGVNTTDTDGYSGYVWAKIRADTTPNLTYLAGGMFGAMGTAPAAPAVTTNAATNITTSSATLNGNLTSLGTALTVNVSFEWGTSSGVYPNETTAQTKTATGAFSSSLSGLNSGTTYYFRTKAVGNGTSYGTEKSFTMLTPAVPPAPPSLDGSTGGPSPARLTSPELKLKYLNINPQQASANQPVTISTNVVNRGGMSGSTNVILKINGQVEESRMVNVSPGAAHPVKFTVYRSQPGTYNVNIGGQKGSFTILGAGSGSISSIGTGGLIAIIVVGILLICSVVLLFRRLGS